MRRCAKGGSVMARVGPIESMARPHIVAALRGFNVPLPDKDSAAWAWLVAQFDERIHQLSAWALSRHEGGKALPGDGALPRAPLSTEAPIATSASAPALGGKKISEAFAAFEAYRLAEGDSRSVRASLNDYRAAITTFIEFFGDVGVGSITRIQPCRGCDLSTSLAAIAIAPLAHQSWPWPALADPRPTCLSPYR